MTDVGKGRRQIRPVNLGKALALFLCMHSFWGVGAGSVSGVDVAAIFLRGGVCAGYATFSAPRKPLQHAAN